MKTSPPPAAFLSCFRFRFRFRTAAVLSLVAMATAGGTAFAQQYAQGQVVSTTPLTLADGSTAYAVTYDYNGSRYTTRTASPPGATIALRVDGLGVTTVESGGNDGGNSGGIGGGIGGGDNDGTNYTAGSDPGRMPDARSAAAAPWQNVTPEPGVVVSGRGAAPAGVPVYTTAAPVYVPAPVYVQPAPVYVAPGYGYGGYGGYGYGGYGYAYPPVGVSLNFGYSRGWGGGYYRRGWR